MRLVLITILLVFMHFFGALAQFSPVYTTYMLNGLTLNPAYAGSQEVLSLSFLHRDQWAGFEGAPQSELISAHAQVKDKRVGLGLLFLHDQLGPTSSTGVFGNYAYRLNVGKSKLAFGLKGGFNYLSYSESALRLSDEDDQSFNINESSFLPNFGVGIFFKAQKFYAGVSIPSFLSQRESSTTGGFEMYHDMANYNYVATAGAIFVLSEEFKIQPSLLFQYNQKAPPVLDVNSLVVYRDFLWVGAGYRAKSALMALVQVRLYPVIPQLKLGYAYDYSLGKLSKFGSGSHEIVMSYEFSYTIKASNPRYF